ncbi:aspartic proteinase CDR1-like [Henckelia pumila]|uniref:aspartic proteinase CDR1-like n=1 Tax=Henckelia pumila TaxID=405737 RepID=UPI003C6E15BA
MALIKMILLLMTIQILETFSSTAPHAITLQLIHRYSIFSPFYDKNISIADRWNNELKSSQTRVEYLQAMINVRRSMSKSGVTTLLFPYPGLTFLTEAYIGNPRIRQYFMMDTGSDLLWVRSTLCNKCKFNFSNIYDPSLSLTMRKVQCYTPVCINFQSNAICNPAEENPLCHFDIEYADGMSVFGNLALERFTFVTPNKIIQLVPNITFGYATGISRDNMYGIHGIIGLQATNPYALVSLFGRKFSYCIGSIRDSDYKYNHLSLGSAAVLQGYSTPTKINYGGYHLVTVEGISLGQKQLEIDENKYKSNVVIDSGSTFSYVEEIGYESILDEVDNLMDGILNSVNIGDNELCYLGNIDGDLQGFPLLTFHFSERADLEIGVDGIFYPFNETIFCLAIRRKIGIKYPNIIGVLAQQYYNVGFDLDDNRIYFRNIDCDALEP